MASTFVTTRRLLAPIFGVCLALLLAAAASHAAEPLPLRAGPLTMVFEPDNAFLRYIRVGRDEVLRGVSAPVRNQFWGTVPPVVTIAELDRRADGFKLVFDVVCREREVNFSWHGTIVGTANGTIDYTFDGQAAADFKRNRIGFCVLHGETAAGRPWRLETTEGKEIAGAFPTLIAPHQPAKDLRGVAHEFAPGKWCRVKFEGETFEMEDQRNWTDASFKTYCTPLAIPYPVQVTKGTKVRQRILLSLDPQPAAAAVNDEDAPTATVTIGGEVAALPGVGVRVSSQAEELTAEEVRRLKAARFDHLRVDLYPGADGFSKQLTRAARQAGLLGVKLIAAVHLGSDSTAELKRLVRECDTIKPPVAAWLVIAADRATFVAARDALRPRFPEVPIGLGQDANFTELNRNRPDLAGVEVVSYGLNPQVHAFDAASMIETLPIQGQTVASARQFLGAAPIVVSPVTLRVQAVDQQPLPGELPANVDPRQSSHFAAAWTLGSIKYLAESNVSRVTYFETVGWQGIMAADTPIPHKLFPARAGAVYPVYHVLRSVNEFSGGRVVATKSSAPASVVGLMLRRDGRTRILLANLTAQPRSTRVVGLSGRSELSTLRADAGSAGDDAWSAPSAVNDAELKLDISPHGVVRIDSDLK